MSELQLNIKNINDKLQRLVRNYQQLLKDNERQSKLIRELQNEKTKNTEQINLMQQQLDILKASAGQMDMADKKAFEKNINQYIKEIDKCIGLLSE
jgi:chromosome segregation ATPase